MIFNGLRAVQSSFRPNTPRTQGVLDSGVTPKVTSSGAPPKVTSSGAPPKVTSFGAPPKVTSFGARSRPACGNGLIVGSASLEPTYIGVCGNWFIVGSASLEPTYIGVCGNRFIVGSALLEPTYLGTVGRFKAARPEPTPPHRNRRSVQGREAGTDTALSAAPPLERLAVGRRRFGVSRKVTSSGAPPKVTSSGAPRAQADMPRMHGFSFRRAGMTGVML